MISNYILAVLSASTGVLAVTGKFEFYSYDGLPGALSFGRVDPIIAPGQVSGHVHALYGSNAINVNYGYDTIQQSSTCTTMRVQQDLSNYWFPALYHYDGISNFNLLISRFSVYYWGNTNSYDPNNANGQDKRYAFPEQFKMLAGNMMQRTLNYSDPASMAEQFQCQITGAPGGGPYSRDMRDFQRQNLTCDLGLRATVGFPSCWDGLTDNSDNLHVVYPNNNGVCPQSHGMALMRLVFEYYWPVNNFPLDPTRLDNWVLSFGDTSGFGLHGDFTNGWNTTLLQEAIDTCNVSSFGIENCPAFAPWNHTVIPPCSPNGLFPNENVGMDNQPLSQLPGDNPIWRDNSSKPSWSDPPATPAVDLRWGPDLSNWNYVSCLYEYDPMGPLLQAHVHSNWANMTTDSCLAECAAGNYSYAAMAFGNVCACDTHLHNNYSLIADPNYPCTARCSGQFTEYCGGWWGSMLYKACVGDECQQNADLPVVQTAAPTWGNYWAGPTSSRSTSTISTVSSTVATNTSSTTTSSSSATTSSTISTTSSSTVATNTSTTFSSSRPTTTSSIISTSTSSKPTSTLTTSTTSLATPTTTSTSLTCPANNAQNFTIGSNIYQLSCSTDLANHDLRMVYTPSVYACAVACSNTTSCVAAAWVPGSPGPCYMKSAVGQALSSKNVWSVKLLNGAQSIVVPNILCPANDGQIIVVSNSSQSQSQNSQNYPSSQSQALQNINSTAGVGNITSFQIQCGVDHPGNAAMVYTSSMYACLQACAGMQGCTDVSYVAAGGACYMKTQVVSAVAELIAVGGVQRVWGAVVLGRT